MDTVASIIGPYRVVRKLGEGGMGAVYEAVHQAIGRRVAIKVLHPEFSHNEEVISRFFNEARAVNIVEHPGLVQISDYGQLPDGTAYIVMEYLKGESLAKRLTRSGGVLSHAEVLQVGWQIADSLAAAHDQGIVHRDLKPDNVMMVPDPHMPIGERTKLLDFGIAKLSPQAGDSKVRTRTNTVMGTPRYMSPEQCRGAGAVDARSDVYSLGVMLYEMLTGRTPFEADAPGDLMVMHLRDAPPPIQQFVPNLSPNMVVLVDGLLGKDPSARPSMREVASTLLHLQSQQTAHLAARTRAVQPAGELASASHDQRTPASPPLKTTLASATGQSLISASEPQKRRWFVMTTALGCLLLFGLVGSIWRLRPPGSSRVSEQPAVSPSAPAPKQAAQGLHVPKQEEPAIQVPPQPASKPTARESPSASNTRPSALPVPVPAANTAEKRRSKAPTENSPARISTASGSRDSVNSQVRPPAKEIKPTKQRLNVYDVD